MKTTSILLFTSALAATVFGSSIPVEDRNVEVRAGQSELAAFWQNDVAYFGEKVNESNSLEKRKCTKCVGHHGSCVVGEGNCYAPDGCYFCGGCNVNQARCQNPNSESCQCYK